MVNNDSRLSGQLSTEDNIATDLPLIGDLDTKDAIVAYAPAFFFLTVVQFIIPPQYETVLMVLIVIAVIGGTIALIVAPEHTPVGTFMSRFWHFRRRPKKVRYRRPNQKEDILERSFIEKDERTQDLPNIKKIHPKYDVIEREDGTILGALQVQAPNLDMVNARHEQGIVENVKDFYDNTLDFKISFYITTRKLILDDMLEKYKYMRDNSDKIRNNPILEYYNDHHIRWQNDKIGGRYKREYYIVIPVTRKDVYEQYGEEDTILSGLSDLPVIGKVISRVTGSSEGAVMSSKELKMKQIETLNDRLLTVQSGFIGSLGEDADTKFSSSAKFAMLFKEFWEGEQVRKDTFESLVSASPVVIGKKDMNIGDNNE